MAGVGRTFGARGDLKYYHDRLEKIRLSKGVSIKDAQLLNKVDKFVREGVFSNSRELCKIERTVKGLSFKKFQKSDPFIIRIVNFVESKFSPIKYKERMDRERMVIDSLPERLNELHNKVIRKMASVDTNAALKTYGQNMQILSAAKAKFFNGFKDPNFELIDKKFSNFYNSPKLQELEGRFSTKITKSGELRELFELARAEFSSAHGNKVLDGGDHIQLMVLLVIKFDISPEIIKEQGLLTEDQFGSDLPKLLADLESAMNFMVKNLNS